MRKRRKTKTLILGDSLSSNVYVTQDLKDLSDSIILSWVGAPSSLDGWDFTNTCIDRLPLFLEKTECLEYLGLEALEVNYNYVLIGEEESLKTKVSLLGEDTYYTWYDLFSRKYNRVYKPLLSWCQVIKILRSKSRIPRLYANIRSIDPSEKIVLLEGGATIEYENIVSSVPQDLLLSKLRGVNLEDIPTNYAYLPYSISLIISKIDQKIRDDEVIIYALGRKRYIASHAILLKAGVNSKNNYVLIYMLTPLKQGASKTEVLIKNLSELKNLGIRVQDIMLIRSYVEKYGKIFRLKKDPYDKLLKELSIKVIGRYGSWEELSICNIINTVLSSRMKHD
ncbi:MAG: hypothetical protein ACP5KB_00640 [Thermoprotei archaeon]